MLIYNEETCFETANTCVYLRNIYATLRNTYATLRNTYATLRNTYATLRNTYATLRHIYATLRNTYATLRHIYACFRLSRVMESRSMSMQEYIRLNIKAMFQPLSVPATGKAGRHESTKARRRKGTKI